MTSLQTSPPAPHASRADGEPGHRRKATARRPRHRGGPPRLALHAVRRISHALALENDRLVEALRAHDRERARTEERLHAALAELARASRHKAMGELAAAIVHEVSQPIAALDIAAAAAARWLAQPTPDLAEARAMLERIGHGARRAKGVVQGLRDLARQAPPRLEPLDLAEALREALSFIGTTLQELGVELATQGLDAPCPVLGDRTQLQQVVINLLMNGAEAMAGVAGPRPLALACAVDGDLVRVSVADAGTGLPAGGAPQLLQPFFTTKPGGMGMGLAICRSIVEAHHGSLALAARDGAGATASFTLPRRAG